MYYSFKKEKSKKANYLYIKYCLPLNVSSFSLRICVLPFLKVESFSLISYKKTDRYYYGYHKWTDTTGGQMSATSGQTNTTSEKNKYCEWRN